MLGLGNNTKQIAVSWKLEFFLFYKSEFYKNTLTGILKWQWYPEKKKPTPFFLQIYISLSLSLLSLSLSPLLRSCSGNCSLCAASSPFLWALYLFWKVTLTPHLSIFLHCRFFSLYLCNNSAQSSISKSISMSMIFLFLVSYMLDFTKGLCFCVYSFHSFLSLKSILFVPFTSHDYY